MTPEKSKSLTNSCYAPLAPLIPGWLDNAGLRPIEYRVLAHLWHRARQRRSCWTKAETISKQCRINKDTVWRVLKLLESRGFVKRQRGRTRLCNSYQVFVPGSEGLKPDGIRGLTPTGSSGFDVAESKGFRPDDSRGQQEGIDRIRNNSEKKQGGNEERPPSCVGLRYDSTWSADLEGQFEISEAAILGLWNQFCGQKYNFPQDIRGRTHEEIKLMFMNWLNRNKTLIKQSRTQEVASGKPKSNWVDLLRSLMPDESHPAWSQLQAALLNRRFEMLPKSWQEQLSDPIF